MATYFPSSSSPGESATTFFPSSCAEPQLLPYTAYPPSFELSRNPNEEGTTDFIITRFQEDDQFSTWKGQLSFQGQDLSLSLATEIPSGFQMPSDYQELNLSDNKDRELHFGNQEEPGRMDGSRFEVPRFSNVVPNLRYLKATQQLLDEVVNLKQALKKANGDESDKVGREAESLDENAMSPHEGETLGKDAAELSPMERHSWQSKLTQLLTMLDQIDRKYKQYYHEMQIVVSSFDTVAGSGAATPYTALALRTISSHFRSMRDAVSCQIRATQRSLGDSDASSSEKGVGLSRLRHLDQRLREQKALRHFGMMQHHAWRSQRGLPESSVSVLRSWLFDHFLHPYPKDSEKIMLARQTGLTRGQVSNWFINARVRLWKPMVEEMYKEETGSTKLDPPENVVGPSSSTNNPTFGNHEIEMADPTATEFENNLVREAQHQYVPLRLDVVAPISGLRADSTPAFPWR